MLGTELTEVYLVRRWMRALVVLGAAGMIGATALPARALVDNAPMRTWQTNGRVTAILRVGNTVYIGGNFSRIDDGDGRSLARNNAAAFVATTGVPTMWNPNANGAVRALAVSPDRGTIFAGGDFSRIGGGDHSRIAALEPTRGKARANWRGSASGGGVKALVVSGELLMLGGSFGSIGGESRRSIGAVSVSDGAVRKWNPGGSDGEIRSMVAVQGRLVVCGTFERVGGEHEPFVAGIRIASADVYNWNSHPNQFCIAVTGDRDSVYIGTRDNHFTKYAADNGSQRWSKQGDGNIQAGAVLRGVAYAGGHFAELEGAAEPHLAAFGADNGNRIAWGGNANSNLGVFAMEGAGRFLYIGGDFTRVNGRVQQGFAMFRE